MEFEGDEYLTRLDGFLYEGKSTTIRHELTSKGFTLKPSEAVSDEDLLQTLTELVWVLESEHVIITESDHLTDRELYVQLIEMCDDPTFPLADLPGTHCYWSLIDVAGEDNWLRYYADDDDRKSYAEDEPDDVLPVSELPPYPRPWIPKAS